MILEGIVTSLNGAGEVNVAPMGPLVTPAMDVLRLRPFKTSTTYRNLKQHPEGVFHVTDDVLLLARAAIGRLDAPPATIPAKHVRGVVLSSACRWYEFRISDVDDGADRANLQAEVVGSGRLRDFIGFHRARHAVLEAAILATRTHILPHEDIQRQMAALRVIVEKTAAPEESETAAFALLEDYVNEQFRQQ